MTSSLGKKIPAQSVCDCSVENCDIKTRNYHELNVGPEFNFLCPYHIWGSMDAYIQCKKCDCFFHKRHHSTICKPCERIKPYGSNNKICYVTSCGSYYTKYVCDPFLDEIYGKKVYHWMCHNCYVQACNEI